VYGGTFRLFEREFKRFGLEFSYVDASDLEQIQAGVQENTRMVWLETPTNPLLKLTDIEETAQSLRRMDKPPILVVDNTFATPYLQQPLVLGADIVVHSTTKYLGGHSDVVGGAILCRSDKIHEQLAFLQNAAGAVPGPMDCFLVQRGLKTLPVRMERHASNAAVIADSLAGHPMVESVYYPFHESHHQVALARKQMRNGGGMISFVMKGGSPAARRVAERTRLFTLAESLGGVESLIEVPAAMTHASTSGSPLEVDPALVRLSVGIEHVDDLLEDLDSAISSL
jgi:cystathionine beta-lyase/cystathionine gamma-synthase